MRIFYHSKFAYNGHLFRCNRAYLHFGYFFFSVVSLPPSPSASLRSSSLLLRVAGPRRPLCFSDSELSQLSFTFSLSLFNALSICLSSTTLALCMDRPSTPLQVPRELESTLKRRETRGWKISDEMQGRRDHASLGGGAHERDNWVLLLTPLQPGLGCPELSEPFEGPLASWFDRYCGLLGLRWESGERQARWNVPRGTNISQNCSHEAGPHVRGRADRRTFVRLHLKMERITPLVREGGHVAPLARDLH